MGHFLRNGGLFSSESYYSRASKARYVATQLLCSARASWEGAAWHGALVGWFGYGRVFLIDMYRRYQRCLVTRITGCGSMDLWYDRL